MGSAYQCTNIRPFPNSSLPPSRGETKRGVGAPSLHQPTFGVNCQQVKPTARRRRLPTNQLNPAIQQLRVSRQDILKL